MAALVKISRNAFFNRLVQISLQNTNKAITSSQFSTETPEPPSEAQKKRNVIKSVFISQSNDVFTNLAIEDWIYKNNDFENHQVLLVWRNNPSVVIGRHQNPWIEANLDYLSNKGIDIARRNSGGGTVYHDKGNLNLTFFTPRDKYNRTANLQVIKRAIFRAFSVNLDISPRDDLLLDNHFKISGTASKLGRNNAYHHCTLLINADRTNLSNGLLKSNDEISTKATRSIPSPIKNLRDCSPSMNTDRVLSAVGWEFLRTCADTCEDGGNELIAKQRGFQLINPTDKWFPGLAQIRDDLQSWEWRFGKTPKFTATRQCSGHQDAKLTLQVESGIITDVGVRVAASKEALAKSEGLSDLRGSRYSTKSLGYLEQAFSEPEQERQALRA